MPQPNSRRVLIASALVSAAAIVLPFIGMTLYYWFALRPNTGREMLGFNRGYALIFAFEACQPIMIVGLIGLAISVVMLATDR